MPALAALVALALAADPAAAPASRTTTVALDGRPQRLAALPAGAGAVDVFLLAGRELRRFRLEGRKLTPAGSFRSPGRGSRPIALDAARRDPASGDAVVAVVFGEDERSVDQGTDTTLHAFVLSAARDGGLAPASADLREYLRVVDGKVHAQARGANELFVGPVRVVEGSPGHLAPAGSPEAWASRWLLEATPLPGGTELLAWDGTTPTVVARAGGGTPGAGVVGDFGAVREPQVAIRLREPVFRTGFDDRQGETWHPLPRRVVIAPDGAAFTLWRGRSRGVPLVGKQAGQDAIVRLDRADGELAVARPYPGVEAWILDFALLERPDGAPAVLLLVNEKEDGSGRAQLVLQGPG